MEISRDGRRVPQLIDTSAPGAAAEPTHELAERKRNEPGEGLREREGELAFRA